MYNSYIGSTFNYRQYPVKKLPKGVIVLAITIHTLKITGIQVKKGKGANYVALKYENMVGQRGRVGTMTILERQFKILLSGKEIKHSADGIIHEMFNLLK